MTLFGRVIMFFPITMMLTLLGLVISFAKHPSAAKLALIFAAAYGLPLLAFRIHNFIFSLKEGLQKDFSDPNRYAAWWGGHFIQLIYYWLPFLEVGLRLTPGAYSLWLRLWGAKIGKNVFWGPLVTVEDRSLLEVGNGVIFGHMSKTISHVIYPNKLGTLTCYVKKVKIGDGVFVGAQAQLGPGCVVASGTMIPVMTTLKINKHVDSATFAPVYTAPMNP
ncbi:acyl transferase [Bdellovibrio sp. qaytius]|nr:acyl transferase [Bdellovibrio sp. qaytius]